MLRIRFESPAKLSTGKPQSVLEVSMTVALSAVGIFFLQLTIKKIIAMPTLNKKDFMISIDRNQIKIVASDYLLHSDLRFFTGFALAALIAWKLMVNNAIAVVANPAPKNIHQLIFTR